MNKFLINAEIFASLVEDHKAKFPNAYADVKVANLDKASLFFSTTIYSPECWVNGISHNDPMREHIMIEQVGEDDYIATLDGGRLTILPRPEDRGMAFSGINCRFRKTKGNADKIIKAIKKWQDKRLALVKEVKAEIPNIETSNLKDI